MTKRRPKGEGSVYRRKDRRVVGEYVDANGRTRYITSKTKTKREMQAIVRKALEDRDKGIAYDNENLTVERYFVEHWLVSVRDNVRPGTYRPYEAIVRLHIVPTLGRTKLDKLSALQLEKLYRSKLDTGLSARRVRYILEGISCLGFVCTVKERVLCVNKPIERQLFPRIGLPIEMKQTPL